jgi:hypothetical protein
MNNVTSDKVTARARARTARRSLGSDVPWTGKGFKKHNKKLSPGQATHAARIANAVLKRSGNEGEAIATDERGSYNVIVEADDDRDDGTAAEVARILCEAYPGPPVARARRQGRDHHQAHARVVEASACASTTTGSRSTPRS